jgi:alanine racemase
MEYFVYLSDMGMERVGIEEEEEEKEGNHLRKEPIPHCENYMEPVQ